MEENNDKLNWENFLDNYFNPIEPVTEKAKYNEGLIIDYKKNDIYVSCDLSIDRRTIKKLEFGRLIINEKGKEGTNWIKGVFINDGHFYTTFLQTSFDSEYFDKRNSYTITIGDLNTKIITQFLNTPCLTGWIEKEYMLDKDAYYKVIVMWGDFKWVIKLQDIGEQDIPFMTDALEIWWRVKMADAFWNNSRKTVREIQVKPMNR